MNGIPLCVTLRRVVQRPMNNLSTLAGTLCGLCLTLTVSGAVLQGPVINPANGHTYYLLAETNWLAAEAEAVALGGHLATINDAAENLWVVETFGNFDGQARALWIGLTDQHQEGVWSWIAGQDAPYRNWAPGEPNSGAGYYPDEDYAMIWPPNSGWPYGSWNDSPEDHPHCGVVEVPVARPVQSEIALSVVNICWQSVAGARYQVQSTTSTENPQWVDVGPPQTGTGQRMCMPLDVPPGQAKKFFRVVTFE